MRRILFVCHGNICRSPAAEALFNHFAAAAGLSADIGADSAGVSGYHIGEPADPRMRRTLSSHGIVMAGRARQFSQQDFDRYDLILAMDSMNYADIMHQAPHNAPENRVRLFLSLNADSTEQRDVPDPYYGGAQGFEHVYQLVKQTCRTMLADYKHGRLI